MFFVFVFIFVKISPICFAATSTDVSSPPRKTPFLSRKASCADTLSRDKSVSLIKHSPNRSKYDWKITKGNGYEVEDITDGESSGDDPSLLWPEERFVSKTTSRSSLRDAEIRSSVSIFDSGSDDEDSNATGSSIILEDKTSSTEFKKGKLSPAQREQLSKKFDLTPGRINAAERRNRALYYTTNDPEFHGILSETSNPVERQEIIALKEKYSSPIRDPHLTGKFLTPAARWALSRLEIVEAKGSGLVESWPADATKEPYIPETEEEKTIRRRHKEELSIEAEKRRGKSTKELSKEFSAEAELWENHFTHIQLRKEEIVTGTGKKIRRNEIIELFEEFVMPNYQMLEIEGYEVYFSLFSLDLARSDLEGLSNLDRLKNSLCPIGADGETMNYHHLTHHDAKTHQGRSIVVLITQKLHTQFSGSLHFCESTYRDLPGTPVNRPEFKKARNEFGLKIAEYIEQIRS